MNSQPWEFRAVQLDLARQMESPDTIRRFIDFAAQFGFNTIALYLEGRIRTESFPWPARDQSYTPGEMGAIVEYAASRQLDIVPIIATLGHAGQFLQHDALKPIAELREGGAGRLGTRGLSAFCPSLEETYQFLEGYLSDIAEIFPGKYLHIGCDEVWDMGCCTLCRDRIARGETLDDIYVKHIRRIHQTVVGRLGRKVMMWDDFLEELPTAFDEIPTDIVQCVWQYDTLVDQTKTHFGRRRRDHRLGNYDRRGISYVVCSWAAQGVRNTESLTRYARRFHPLGGLLTLWDGHILEDQYPMIAFSGRRWSNPLEADGKAVCRRAYEELFGISDAMFLDALWSITSMGQLVYARTPEGFLRGPATPYIFERANQCQLLKAVLEPFLDRVSPGFAGDALEAILLKIRRELVQFGLHQVVEELYDGWNGGVDQQEAWLIKGRRLLMELSALADRHLQNWDLHRPGIVEGRVGNSDRFARCLHREMVEFFEAIGDGTHCNTSLFEIRYSLPEFHGCPFTHWSVKYEGLPEWVTIYRGQPKPSGGDYSDRPFYTLKHPFPAGRRILLARVEVSGYGGLGILHVQLRSGRKILHPMDVRIISGLVQEPNNMLIDDTGACWLGELATAEAFHNPSLAQQVHAVEINFGC